jgi:1,4-dihydroxy-6-naphthoate synthase
MPSSSLQLAVSPCPNDTFLFEALAHGQTSLGPLETHFLDIAELNALAGGSDGPDLIKVSCASVPLFLKRYCLLPCGGAMGEGCGPLLLRRPGSAKLSKVAIPGHGTTAHVLFRFYLEQSSMAAPEESLRRFDAIPEAILQGDVDHGVIIHETRFVYREMGLEAAADLGEFWERKTDSPIPLGALLVRRDRGEDFARRAVIAVRESADAAWKRPEPLTPWISQHAQEMAPKVQRAHIATYVTAYSRDIGERGLQALELLWKTAGTLLPEKWPESAAIAQALEETACLRR